MRSNTFKALVLGSLVLTTGLFASGAARAEPEFDVAVAAGKIKLIAKSGWHINKEYPWKLIIGDAKVDKSKFELTETSATLADAPKGKGTLKGAVCSGDSCKTFEKEVTID